ncbi:MAG: GatB/YqeY domain-containing protein [Wenzhouxiangellaceae bacterium]|nr:GatB/YqeY domain-containing protein [Wenzhouxiangellaceae bacterium]
MALKQRIQDDIKQAMKAGDKDRLKVLRMLSAAIKQREVDERVELDDAQVLGVIEKMVKQRRESIEQYTAGNRPELAAGEQAEIDVLSTYLPEPLAEDELERLVDDAIRETGASSMADMGQVMARLKPEIQGRADMKQVSAMVRQRLGA